MHMDKLLARKLELESELQRLLGNHSLLQGHLAENAHQVAQLVAAEAAAAEAPTAEAAAVAPHEDI